MRLVGQLKLQEFARRHADATKSLSAWRKLARAADWRHIADVRQHDPSADPVGRFTIFDVRSYRVVTVIDYTEKVVEIYGVYTHDEYDRIDWKRR